MKKICLILIVMVALCLPIFPLSSGPTQERCPIQFAYAQDSNQTGSNQTISNLTAENSFSWDRSFYKVTKVEMTFPATNEHSVTGITTIGGGDYSYGGNPGATNLEFICKDVDVYTFTLWASYDNATSRDILITIWEGDRPAEGYIWTAIAADFVLHFRLNVIDQPSIPTKDELAAAVVAQQAQLIVNLTRQYEDLVAQGQQANFTISIMSAITIMASIGVIVIAGFNLRKNRKQPGDTN